ncbi:MAG: hypothetical protein Q8M07_05525 [Prosthecobacter sp.]|jgi:hypothetical protein|nr:hypothetical protein [Prosthecobacter sp.]
MQLTEAEIAVGLVAYLDEAVLYQDPRIFCTSPQPSREVRPFICFRVEDGVSQWTPVTTQFKAFRLFLEPAWRWGGGRAWRQERCYLTDGANVYIGPHAAFCTASEAENSRPRERAHLSADGVAAVLAVVEQRRPYRQQGLTE